MRTGTRSARLSNSQRRTRMLLLDIVLDDGMKGWRTPGAVRVLGIRANIQMELIRLGHGTAAGLLGRILIPGARNRRGRLSRDRLPRPGAVARPDRPGRPKRTRLSFRQQSTLRCSSRLLSRLGLRFHGRQVRGLCSSGQRHLWARPTLAALLRCSSAPGDDPVGRYRCMRCLPFLICASTPTRRLFRKTEEPAWINRASTTDQIPSRDGRIKSNDGRLRGDPGPDVHRGAADPLFGCRN